MKEEKVIEWLSQQSQETIERILASVSSMGSDAEWKELLIETFGAEGYQRISWSHAQIPIFDKYKKLPDSRRLKRVMAMLGFREISVRVEGEIMRGFGRD